MGELARRLDSERRLFRGLRPEAYALAAHCEAIAGPEQPVVDAEERRQLGLPVVPLVSRAAGATTDRTLLILVGIEEGPDPGSDRRR